MTGVNAGGLMVEIDRSDTTSKDVGKLPRDKVRSYRAMFAKRCRKAGLTLAQTGQVLGIGTTTVYDILDTPFDDEGNDPW